MWSLFGRERDPEVNRRRRRFRLIRTREQARLASVTFVVAGVLITAFNVLFSVDRAVGQVVPDVVCVAALVASGVIVRLRRVPDAAIPWTCAVTALVLVELTVLQTWWYPSDLGAQYALVIMAVYGVFVLNFPAMLLVAVPMLVSYILTMKHVVAETHVDPALSGDFALLALTALVIGGLIVWLRLTGIDSLSDAMAETDAMATHDPLTGLLNRRAFSERATQLVADAVRHGEKVVALFVDVDHLKTINDAHGHATGDRVLTVVATSVAQAVRAGDLAARWGGDEFVVLGTSNHPEAFVEHLRHAIHQTSVQMAVWDGRVSIGCATATAEHLDWHDVVAGADADMYAQRRRDRSR